MLIAIPFFVILFFSIFGADLMRGKKKKAGASLKPPSGIDKDGNPIQSARTVAPRTVRAVHGVGRMLLPRALSLAQLPSRSRPSNQPDSLLGATGQSHFTQRYSN